MEDARAPEIRAAREPLVWMRNGLENLENNALGWQLCTPDAALSQPCSQSGDILLEKPPRLGVRVTLCGIHVPLPPTKKQILRGFWDRGRVCGDRSVFVTSHRPAHSSCAHAFSLDRIFAFRI